MDKPQRSLETFVSVQKIMHEQSIMDWKKTSNTCLQIFEGCQRFMLRNHAKNKISTD